MKYRHTLASTLIAFSLVTWGCTETTEDNPYTGTLPGTNPGTSTGTNPGTSTGSNPGTSTGTNPGTSTGSNPGTSTGTNPGTNPPAQQGCNGIPDTGMCDGAVVKYCQDNSPQSYDCAQEGKACGSTGDNSYGCVDSGQGQQGGCNGIPDTGVCDGAVVKYCQDNSPQSYDCAQEGKTCGSTGDNSYGCVNSGQGQQGGSQYSTAEDWARARIAGQVSTAEAFEAISKSTGFPVITDDNTVIFMHWYEGGNWAVAGDFNNWEKQAMTNSGDIWYAEVPRPDASQNYYKFVKNDNEYQSDPWSLYYNYTDDGEISYITKPGDAHLMRWNGFKSPQGLVDRTIRAYVPAGNGPFDVLYAHDGQNLFRTGKDGAGSWRVQEAMANVGANFIVVGIDNTPDRMSEYSHVNDEISCGGAPWSVAATGDKYADFVQNTVRPFIESKLPTTAKAGVMGSSLGGLISLYIGHRYPDKYKAVLALSPTTAWGRFGSDNGTLIQDLYVQAGHRNFVLYLDNGGYENNGYVCGTLNQGLACSDEMDTDKHDDHCYTRSFVDKMAEIGYQWDVDLFHWYEENTGHNEIAWHGRLANKERGPLIRFMNAN